MMTESEAREYRAAWNKDVSDLYGKRVHELRQTAAGLRAGVGWERVYGKSSKDELVSEILDFRYSVAALNMTTHVLYHKPGQPWGACEHCHPHRGEMCECPLKGISR